MLTSGDSQGCPCSSQDSNQSGRDIMSDELNTDGADETNMFVIYTRYNVSLRARRQTTRRDYEPLKTVTRMVRWSEGS